jgi:hypothetical protein
MKLRFFIHEHSRRAGGGVSVEFKIADNGYGIVMVDMSEAQAQKYPVGSELVFEEVG